MKIFDFSNLLSRFSELRRFPLPIAAALIATVSSIVSIHCSSTPVDEQCMRICLTMLFGLPLLVGAVYGAEFHPRFRLILHAGSLIAMAGIFHLLPLGMPEGAIWFRFSILVLMAFCVASTIPGLAREGWCNWWRVNIGWLNSLVLAVIMSGIVEIGLQLALLSVEKLFGLEAHHGKLMVHLHADLFALVAWLIGPVTAFALFPSAREDFRAETPGFKVWGSLCKWALIPIGFLFMGILAAYAAKILIQWKLPNGLVATPVLSLGAYGTLAMLLVLPWKDQFLWARWFSRIYPPAFLLSSCLLFVSLAVRIREYGVTLDRYSALAAGIWLTFSAPLFLIRQKQAPVLVPLLLALVSLVTALGPLSAGTLTLRSQSERLKHLLDSKNRDDEQIRSIVRMIVQEFGLSDLEKTTGSLGLDPTLNRWQLADAALQKLNVSKEKADRGSNQYDLPEGTSIPIDGCTRYLKGPYDGWNGSRAALLGSNTKGEELLIKFALGDDMRLILQAGSREIASCRFKDLDFESALKNKLPVMITLEGEGRSFLVLITRAYWNYSSKERKLFNISYQVFEKQPVPVLESDRQSSSTTSATANP
jgi:hypothetical protein